MLTKRRENIEIAVSVILLILLATCLDPFESLLPASWQQALIILLIASYGVFTGLFFRERGRDEREKSHLLMADRIAFLIGIGLLVLFIILDMFSFSSEKDLIFILGGMLLTKLAALVVLRLLR